MVTMPKRQEAFRSDYREKISRWYSGPGRSEEHTSELQSH